MSKRKSKLIAKKRWGRAIEWAKANDFDLTGGERWTRKGIRIARVPGEPITGQTRRGGSHRDNRGHN